MAPAAVARCMTSPGATVQNSESVVAHEPCDAASALLECELCYAGLADTPTKLAASCCKAASQVSTTSICRFWTRTHL